MVRYLDPEDNPELGEERRRRSSPGERLARARERNAALTGTAAIEAAREVALRKLDARACSRSELTSAIEGRGFSAEIAARVPSTFFVVGGGTAQDGCGVSLHNPKIRFREEALIYGAAAYASGAAMWLELH